jgi:hypothetical protein
MKMRHILSVALLTATPLLSWAAGPQLVGTFTGTAKLNTYNVAGTLTKTKVPMTIEIAQDDSTTLTLGASIASNPEAAFGDNNGILLDISTTFKVITFQVKNTSMKGLIQGIDEEGSPAQTIVDGKFKLKKAQ